MKKRRKKQSIIGTLILIVLISVYFNFQTEIKDFIYTNFFPQPSYSIEEIPEYKGEDYVLINNNEPFFTEEDKNTKSYESYSKLDYLGRAGVAIANIDESLMPTEERGQLDAKPSGWHTVRYDDVVPGKYLYNRCHLIGFQLTGENDNMQNLITCTRQMNTGVMLEYENKVAKYLKESHNHVLYRVTPIYEGTNLLASGIEMEGLSIEDNGKGIKFNIYIYNVQEGINIDYKTGDSSLKE